MVQFIIGVYVWFYISCSPLFFWLWYQWHSTTPKVIWVVLTVMSLAFKVVLLSADAGMHFNWGATSIYRTYIRPITHELPEEKRDVGKYLALVRELGIYSEASLERRRCASQRKCRVFRLELVAVAGLGTLLCHFGKLVIALTAFIRAPDRIYNVPNYGVLEALGHVGR